MKAVSDVARAQGRYPQVWVLPSFCFTRFENFPLGIDPPGVKGEDIQWGVNFQS